MILPLIRSFRDKLAAGAVLGPFSKTEDPAMVEAMGYGGFDFLILDLEHGPNSTRSLQHLVRAAQIAGIASGDRIVSIDGKSVRHAIEAQAILNSTKPERTKIVVERDGKNLELNVVLSWNAQGKSNLGLSYKTETHAVRGTTNLESAVSAGFSETWSTFDSTFKGLASLFQGVNLLKALSGPARITYMVGQSATEGIQRSSSGGLAMPLNFLAFLSISLFIMNLLPIPALDGGQIVMFVTEGIRRRALRPITIYRYQAIGATFILALFVFVSFGDLLFFAAK
jgi:regulator of sigma E protease